MAETSRRQLIKAAGVGAGVALGAGGASAQEASTDQTEVVASFNGVVNNGFLVIDGKSPDDSNASANVSLSDLNGDIIIDGEIYDDKTWQSTNVNFPDLKAADIVDFSDLPVGPDDLTTDDIQVNVATITGTYDPAQPLVTGDIDLTIDATIVASLIGITAEFDFTIDLNGSDDITLTTGQSGSLEGSASNLEGSNTSATVVNNNFTVPKAEGKVEADPPLVDPINVNDELNLPSNDPSRNFVELQLDISWVNGPPDFGPSLPALPGRDNPPTDPDGDGLFEDIRGEGNGATMMDVQTLFMNLRTEEVQNNSQAFNFQGANPDEVGILDVQALYDKHVNNS